MISNLDEWTKNIEQSIHLKQLANNFSRNVIGLLNNDIHKIYYNLKWIQMLNYCNDIFIRSNKFLEIAIKELKSLPDAIPLLIEKITNYINGVSILYRICIRISKSKKEYNLKSIKLCESLNQVISTWKLLVINVNYLCSKPLSDLITISKLDIYGDYRCCICLCKGSLGDSVDNLKCNTGNCSDKNDDKSNEKNINLTNVYYHINCINVFNISN